MLVDHTLFGTVDKVTEAIERLRQYEPPEGYYLAFSGGKDSVTVRALADMAGVKYDAHYSLTTVDPPELVKFIKQVHPDVEIKYPKTTLWRLMVKKTMPPTRTVRYCCSVLKEQGGKGRVVLTGVRRQESSKRAGRQLVEDCKRDKTQTFINPIVDWMDEDVWEFIHKYNVPYCSLYDEGFKRLGCIGCPLAGRDKQNKELERWPKYKEAYLRTFERIIQERKRRGMPCRWETAQDIMDWWQMTAGRNVSQCDDDQGVLFE